MIRAVDRSLGGYAAALVKYAEGEAVRSRLLDMGPLVDSLRLRGDQSGQPDGLEAVRLVATRPWHDLVYRGDYFGPSGTLNLRPDLGIHLHPAELVPMLDAGLRLPGDHVSGMALRRIDYWRSDLHGFWVRCSSVAHALGKTKAWEAVQQARQRLVEALNALRERLASGARLRQACICLVQAYAEFSPKPDLDWLGPNMPKPLGSGLFRHWLVNHGEVMVASRIALSLGTVCGMYHTALPPDEAIKEAARSHDLLLAQGLGTRILYWKGQKLSDTGFTPLLWETLWALARRAQHRNGIDHSDFGTDKSPHALTCRISRLKKLLPRALAQLIHPANANQTYVLEVAGSAIHLAELDSAEGAMEVGGANPLRLLSPVHRLSDRD